MNLNLTHHHYSYGLMSSIVDMAAHQSNVVRFIVHPLLRYSLTKKKENTYL